MLSRTASRSLAVAGTGAVAGPLLVALAAQSSPVTAGAALCVLAAGGALIAWPYGGFLLTAAVVPLERIGRLTNDSSAVGFSLMRVVGFATLACFLAHQLVSRRRVVFATPFLFYAAYAVYGVVSLAWTTDMEYGVRTVAAILGNVMFFFLVINIVQQRWQARAALICWLVVTTAIGLFTIYQWHNPAAVMSEEKFNSTGERTGDERFSTVLSDTSEYQLLEQAPRALGSTSHPAVYGINLILSLPFFAYLFRTTRTALTRLAIAAAGAITCYNVVLSNTRAALITMAVTVVLIVLTRLVRVTAPMIVCALLATVAAVPLLPPALFERVLDVSKYTVNRSDTLRARLTYWNEGLEMVAENWLLGIGIGNQTELPRRLRPRMDMPPNSSVHNEYLQSLVETGVLGYPLLVTFVVLLYRRCRLGERVFRAGGDPDAAWLCTAARVSLLSTLFYATQVDVLHFPLKGWWLAMGLVVALTERLPLRPVAVAAESL
jgi:O-Antigen ligase